MSNITQPRLHHLAITVTDLDASVRWYESVFDVHPVLDIPHPGGVGRILAGTDRQLMIALHRHDDNDGGLFTETTTGLDHGGFAVPRAAIWNSGRSTSKPTASYAPTQPTSH